MSTINWGSCPKCLGPLMSNGRCPNCETEEFSQVIQKVVFKDDDHKTGAKLKIINFHTVKEIVSSLCSEGYEVSVRPIIKLLNKPVSKDNLEIGYYEIIVGENQKEVY